MKFTEPTYMVFAKLEGELSFPEYPLYKNITKLEDARAMAAEAVTKGCYKSAMVVGTLAVFHGAHVAMEEIGAPYRNLGMVQKPAEVPMGTLEKDQTYCLPMGGNVIVEDHSND
jgi:hypothetical protein